MRWGLLGLALLVAVLLYRGSVAFVSSLSGATAAAPRGGEAPAKFVAPTMQLEALTPPGRSAEPIQVSAPGMSRPGPAPQPSVASAPVDTSPVAVEQRVFQSRRALETTDPREFLRQSTMPK